MCGYLFGFRSTASGRREIERCRLVHNDKQRYWYKGGWSFGFPRPLVSEVHMVRAHAQELARKF